MIILILIFILSVFFLQNKENFQENITFITLFDYDNYIQQFNNYDFKVRNCKDNLVCAKLYKNNILKFTQTEKNKLISLIKQVNSLTKDYNNFYSLQWKFCKISNKIDMGMPHTHDNIIFISEKFLRKSRYYQLVTLIHEKLHVYQRLYPEKTQKLYKLYGYKKYNKYDISNRRLNPDLDKYDYGINGILFYRKYNKNPSSLKDSYIKCIDVNTGKEEKSNNCNYAYEHPNEIFAWKYSKQIVNKNITDSKFIKYLT